MFTNIHWKNLRLKNILEIRRLQEDTVIVNVHLSFDGYEKSWWNFKYHYVGKTGFVHGKLKHREKFSEETREQLEKIAEDILQKYRMKMLFEKEMV